MRNGASLPRTGMSHRVNNKLLPKWQWSFTIPITRVSLIMYVIKDGGRVIGYDLIHYVMRKRQNGPCPLPEPVRAISLANVTQSSGDNVVLSRRRQSQTLLFLWCQQWCRECSLGKFSLIHSTEPVDLMAVKNHRRSECRWRAFISSHMHQRVRVLFQYTLVWLHTPMYTKSLPY